MKKINFFPVFAIFCTLLIVAACNHSDKDSRSDQDSIALSDSITKASEVMVNNVTNEKNEAKQRLDNMMKDIDVRLEKIDMDMKKADKKTQMELQEQKSKLKTNRNLLQRNYDQVDKTVDNEWGDFKHAVNESMDSIKNWLK